MFTALYPQISIWIMWGLTRNLHKEMEHLLTLSIWVIFIALYRDTYKLVRCWKKEGVVLFPSKQWFCHRYVYWCPSCFCRSQYTVNITNTLLENMLLALQCLNHDIQISALSMICNLLNALTNSDRNVFRWGYCVYTTPWTVPKS